MNSLFEWVDSHNQTGFGAADARGRCGRRP